MENTTVKRVWVATTAVIVMIAFIVFTTAFGWNNLHVVLLAANFAVILIVLSVVLWGTRKKLQDKKAGFSIRDERTKYLEGRAAYYTVHVGLYFMLGLMWYTFLAEGFNLPELNVTPALLSSLLVMALLMIGLRWHFLRKGDVK